jgi:hypothetical protein
MQKAIGKNEKNGDFSGLEKVLSIPDLSIQP